MINFDDILRMRQKELKHYLSGHLKKEGYEVISKKGFLYAKGDTPVLLVAHLDTVHQQLPSIICRSDDGRYLMSPQGIGGDDRCGVYMILQIINEVRCHVLFCEDEETGGNGARAFAGSGIQIDVNYIVEMDRRGNNDTVFYDCSNPEFTEFVCAFGFQERMGSFSDISVIAPYLKTAAVNISAGYYNEHRLNEVIDTFAMQNNVGRIIQMALTQTKKFPYMKRQFSYRQQTLFDMGFDDRGKEKLLMELPQNARLMMNGYEIIPSCNYLIDRDGNVYVSVPELDAAVLSENSVACDENGELLCFSVFDARRMKVITMESAMEQLEMGNSSMPAFLCDELREYIDMLYFPAPDQRIFTITKSKLTHRFHKLSEEAGLRRITVHGLRHSHVSLLISKKYDIFEVSKRIGHKSIKTTQDIYGHLFDEVQKTIANDLDSLRRR